MRNATLARFPAWTLGGLLLLLGSCRSPTPVQAATPPFGRAPRSAGPAPVVTGTAIEASSLKPLAGVLIRGPNGVETRSDAQGRFVLRGLEPGLEGELVGTTESGLQGRNWLRPLAGGLLEIVLYLR